MSDSVASSKWAAQKCVPCEGGIDPLTQAQLESELPGIPAWQISDDSKSIERKWVCKNFDEAIDRLNRIAALAEAEQHHPDLHLTGYRNLKVVLTTHAIGGLSKNDLIVAAKIDRLPDNEPAT